MYIFSELDGGVSKCQSGCTGTVLSKVWYGRLTIGLSEDVLDSFVN